MGLALILGFAAATAALILCGSLIFIAYLKFFRAGVLSSSPTSDVELGTDEGQTADVSKLTISPQKEADVRRHRWQEVEALLGDRAAAAVIGEGGFSTVYLASLPIVHGDLTTANVLLHVDLGPKLCDFGSARVGFSAAVRPAAPVVGSPGYADPHYLRTGIASKKSDVYSFGVLLLELLTGRPAIGSEGGMTLAAAMAPRLRGAGSGVAEVVDPRFLYLTRGQKGGETAQPIMIGFVTIATQANIARGPRTGLFRTRRQLESNPAPSRTDGSREDLHRGLAEIKHNPIPQSFCHTKILKSTTNQNRNDLPRQNKNNNWSRNGARQAHNNRPKQARASASPVSK
ncbi:hypothetical protein C4D60_Mb07t22080 [Musa balbisiana]|uniref:Protein kinase domain-containing protein n=1 Tax=Musa balbisiana TaxID=52838 RepID=A0A4S8JH44_MUSBA|nr:hypothetical protein C4D60_Mb07t22080 [Musa balbisiana]